MIPLLLLRLLLTFLPESAQDQADTSEAAAVAAAALQTCHWLDCCASCCDH
jgi:hypothetical protein